MNTMIAVYLLADSGKQEIGHFIGITHLRNCEYVLYINFLKLYSNIVGHSLAYLVARNYFGNS